MDHDKRQNLKLSYHIWEAWFSKISLEVYENAANNPNTPFLGELEKLYIDAGAVHH